MTIGAPQGAHARDCRECHNAVAKHQGIRCSICKKWYCLKCYQKWHIFDCQETDDVGVK